MGLREFLGMAAKAETVLTDDDDPDLTPEQRAQMDLIIEHGLELVNSVEQTLKEFRENVAREASALERIATVLERMEAWTPKAPPEE